MNLAHLLQRIANLEPQRPAIFEGLHLAANHGQWATRCAALASRFAASGLLPGDRVALFMRNHPRYLEVMFGAWWAGLVVVPINAKLHQREAQWITDNAQARWLFISADNIHAEEPSWQGLERVIDIDSAEADTLLAVDAHAHAPCHAIVDRMPDDVAWLFYTSGTTGRPKGVMITHRNLMTMGLTYFNDVDPISARDTIAYAAPMSHGAGIYAIPHLMAGARHVVPASGSFEPAELFALGQSLGPLSMFAAPTIVKRLVDHAEWATKSLNECAQAFKTIVYGGAPMYATDIGRALRVMGPRFVQIYGQGESPMVGTALSRAHLAAQDHPRYAQRIASVGVAQTCAQIRVADAQGNTLVADQVGEILIRGDSVMAGYWRNPQATGQALQNGWLLTGDMGSLDADGFLTLKDRSKDLIISGGSNIYPREVEEVLLAAPGVAEVAVVGAPDPEWGEIVVAFVVAEAGVAIDPLALDALCLQEIARFKRPKRYELVSDLPKNNYGKVLKTELRQRLSKP